MVKIVGHRGAAGYALENTLLSFREAIRIGCHRTELDVRLSKDGTLVVIHDEKVDRVTNGHGSISEMKLPEINALFCAQGQKIPTLQEVVDLCWRKIDLQIELKAKGTPFGVNELLKKNGIEGGVIITSFDEDLLSEMKKINSDLPTGLLFRECPKNIFEVAHKIGLAYICPKAENIDEKMIMAAHALKIKVYAYHTNTEVLGENLIKWGVDDIGTDFPKIFHKYLTKA